MIVGTVLVSSTISIQLLLRAEEQSYWDSVNSENC